MDTEKKSETKFRLSIMLARQRSGTNVLRHCLNTHPLIKAYAEMFNIPRDGTIDLSGNIGKKIDAGKDPLDGCFFPFWVKRQLESEDKFITALQAFSKLLKLIDTRGPKRHKVIDIKYNSVRIIQDLWPPLYGAPAMFDLVKNRNYALIHLTRKNYLAGIVSGKKALQTGVYHVPSGAESPTSTIQVRLDPGELMAELEFRKREDDYVTEHFTGYKDYVRFDYSELFEADGSISAEIMGRIAGMFGVEPDFDLAPKLGKVGARNIAETIENADEIESTLKGTEFEYCLQ